jgi:large subunit ribosomal protein L32
MVTPTNKHSKARTRARRANHDKVTLQKTLLCDNCGADRLPHRACPSCGFYKGRVAVAVKSKTAAEPAAPAE